jgi:hypothetical protein
MNKKATISFLFASCTPENADQDYIVEVYQTSQAGHSNDSLTRHQLSTSFAKKIIEGK